MATRAPKEKRRNSEKRKEKSRDAARCRRSKESEIFTDMAQLLPVPTSLSSQLDKASVMRLTIAFLKARSLLGNSVQELCSLWSEEKCSLADACWPQALGGILLALSSEGDIIYLSENVTQQLGLAQVDLIGQSIYDYCHPCDHDELREVLSLRPDGELARSFFLRLKSTLTVKGRNNNLKTASYKVMNCSGRIVPASTYDSRDFASSHALQEDDELLNEDLEVQVKALTSHFLVLIADSIPHPSNIEMPLDSYTFLTKHSLDMKYTYVDEKIYDFLGYTPKDLEGHSAYQLHHAQDNDIILKSYKTLLTKGQIQTPPYRFLARHGGHAWVQTQATLVYGNRDSRPQAVVCVHTCLSEIEDGDQVLYINQTATTASNNSSLVQRAIAVVASMASRNVETEMPPQNMTSKLFVPKTSDMDEGFLIFDKVNGTTVLKEEPEDLTHLAPIAGDTCIALDMPSLTFPSDLFDAEELTPEFLDCLPLTGFELPLLCAADDEVIEGSEDNAMDEPINCPAPSSSIKEDPFIFFNIQTAPMSASSTDASTSTSPSKRHNELDEEYDSSRPTSVIGTQSNCPMRSTTLCQSDDEEELNRRAPYIPMNESDDLPLFDPSELFSGMDLECLPVLPLLRTESPLVGKDQSVLVKLLQNSPMKLTEDRKSLSTSTQQPPPASSYHAHKRCSITPVDDSNPKRMKPPILQMPTAGPLSTKVMPLPPSRGATSSLLELLTEKPSHCAVLTPEKQSSSVLQNLLVSGRDLQTGHNLDKLHPSCQAISSTSSPIPVLLSSLLSLDKEESPLRAHLTMRNETDVSSPDSSESAGSDMESKPTHARIFHSLNTFPFDMDISPGSSTSIEIDADDFFGTLNLSCEFIAAEGATE